MGKKKKKKVVRQKVKEFGHSSPMPSSPYLSSQVCFRDMAKLTLWILLALAIVPVIIQVAERGDKVFVGAEEDEVEGEEEEDEAATVEDDGVDTDSTGKKNTHPDVETTLLFTRPPANPANYAPGVNAIQLPAGKIVEFLLGFENKADEGDFTLESLDASFRYPMDFTYHIQNFSAINYNKQVKPGQEASLFYSFIPADAFAGRPIGLTINLAYRDQEGNFYFDPVFNETVSIVEFDEGFDSEVFFMYVFLVAGAILLLFLVYTILSKSVKSSKKSGGVARKPVETGTSNSDVDFEWIPRSAVLAQKTPGSNKTSPRQRKGKRGAANASDTE